MIESFFIEKLNLDVSDCAFYSNKKQSHLIVTAATVKGRWLWEAHSKELCEVAASLGLQFLSIQGGAGHIVLDRFPVKHLAESKPVSSTVNKLIVIGWMGAKRVYLNTSRDEAIARYAKSEETTPEQIKKSDVEIKELSFDDEFLVYDAWV